MSFQNNVKVWLEKCFGKEIARDKSERSYRLLEESLELVQATGLTKDEAYQLVDYVYNRPIGEIKQEVGGVMTTLAALCLAHDIDMEQIGYLALRDNYLRIDIIREKQKNKPHRSPLPQ